MAKAVTFTGHRQNKLNGYQATDWVRDRLAEIIHRAYDAGYRHFIAGGALGTDWIAASEVIEFSQTHKDTQLTLALPFEGYNSKWPLEIIERFELEIESNADKVVYVCDPGYAVWKYQKRNEWMIDRCNVVIAVYDGSEGGTQNAVHYAKQCQITTCRFDPKERKESWLRFV